MDLSNATCAAPLGEVLTLCRGRRPAHARRERAGTWEISGSPAIAMMRSRAAPGNPMREMSRRCTVLRSRAHAQYRGSRRTRPVEGPAAEAVEGRRDGQGEGRQPDTTRTLCRVYRVTWTAVPTCRCCMGRPSPDARHVIIQGGNRMRESRESGSVRGARGNPRPYRARSISRSAFVWVAPCGRPQPEPPRGRREPTRGHPYSHRSANSRWTWGASLEFEPARPGPVPRLRLAGADEPSIAIAG